MSETKTPFVLSLSKDRLRKPCFDRLSTNGFSDE